MSMNNAKELLRKINTDVPEFAQDTNVIRLDLGHLYELLTNQKLPHLKNVIFRFVPDKEQVEHAMNVSLFCFVCVFGSLFTFVYFW